MKWKTVFRYDTEFTLLVDYPFFNTHIRRYEHGKYCINREKKEFDNLEDAKKYVIDRVKKELKNFDISSTFTNNANLKICISYTDWCNNNGSGKYIANNEFKKYSWLEGVYLPWCSTSKCYALRFDRSLGEENIKRHGVKILKRHIDRFLKETN